jgi:hypothetical protein
VADQCGNGFAQWYAMDSMATVGQLPRNTSTSADQVPFDFSVDPSAWRFLWGCNVNHVSNSFFYNQVGNVGFIGYSGKYEPEELMPYFEEACQWAGAQEGLDVLMLVGHWWRANMGAIGETGSVTGAYEAIRHLDGCHQFDERRAIKHAYGHMHCNKMYSNGGMVVGGMGMEGCNDYGFPVFDTTGGRIRIFYFPVVTPPPSSADAGADAAIETNLEPVDTYDQVYECILQHGWRKCTHLAITWIDEPIMPRRPAR